MLPVAMGGDFNAFWPEAESVSRIGIRGGFFHPTTGYSLPDAVRVAMLIARFYAGRLTALDKLRILSGRPPVPVGRAMTALRERRA